MFPVVPAVITAIQGQFTMVGYDAPLPRKVTDKALKKLESAEAALKREIARGAARTA